MGSCMGATAPSWLDGPQPACWGRVKLPPEHPQAAQCPVLGHDAARGTNHPASGGNQPGQLVLHAAAAWGSAGQVA